MQHDKFIAAQARDHIAGRGIGFQGFGHQAQDFITDRMAEAVIDLLETVQIDHMQGERRVLLDGALRFFKQAGLEEGAVGEAGQGVIMRQIGDLVFVITFFQCQRAQPRTDVDHMLHEGRLRQGFAAIEGKGARNMAILADDRRRPARRIAKRQDQLAVVFP